MGPRTVQEHLSSRNDTRTEPRRFCVTRILSINDYSRPQNTHRSATDEKTAIMNLGSFGKLTIVYAFAALLLIIELGLTGYVVGQTHRAWWGGSPSQYIPVAALALLALTALFWFAGSIAMAVLVGIPDCNGNNFCQSAQAGVVFGFFNWIVFTGLAIWEGMGFARGRSPSTAKPPPYAGA